MEAGGGKKTAMFMASGLCWMPEKGTGKETVNGSEEEGSRGRSGQSQSENERSETYVSSSMQSGDENEDGSRSWSDATAPRSAAGGGARDREPEYDSLRGLGGSSHSLLPPPAHRRQPPGPEFVPQKAPAPAEEPSQIHLGLSAAPVGAHGAGAPPVGASTELGATDSGHSSSSSTGQAACGPNPPAEQDRNAAQAAGEQAQKQQQLLVQLQQGEEERRQQRPEQGLTTEGSLPRQHEEATASAMAAPSFAGSVLSPTAAASRVCSAASPAVPFSRGAPTRVPAPAQPGQNLPCPAPLLLLPSPSLPGLPSDLLSAVATLPLCGLGSEGQRAVEKTGSCTQSAADEALDTTLSLSLGPPVAKAEGEGKSTPQTSNFSIAAPVVEALELAAPAEELSLSEDTGGTALAPKRTLSDAKLPGWLGAHQPAPSGGPSTDKSGSPSLDGGSAPGAGGALEFTLALAGGISDNSSSGSHMGLHHLAHAPHPPPHAHQQALGLHLHAQQQQQPRGPLGPAVIQSALGAVATADTRQQQPQQQHQQKQGVPAAWAAARHEDSPTAAWVAAAPKQESAGLPAHQHAQVPAAHAGPWQVPGAPAEGPLLKALQPGPRKLMGVPLSAASTGQGPIKLLHIGTVGSHRPEGPKGENAPPQGLPKHPQNKPLGPHAPPRAGMGHPGVYPQIQIQGPLHPQQPHPQQQAAPQPGMLQNPGTAPAPSHQQEQQGMPGHGQAPLWAQAGKVPEMGLTAGSQAPPQQWRAQQQQHHQHQQPPQLAHQQQQVMGGPQQLTPPPPAPLQLSPHGAQPQAPYNAPPNHLQSAPPQHHQPQQHWHRGNQQPQQYPYQQPQGQYPQRQQPPQQSAPSPAQAWQGPGQSSMAPSAPSQGHQQAPPQGPWVQEAPLRMPPPPSQQPTQHLGAPPHTGQALGHVWGNAPAPHPQQPQHPQQYGHQHHAQQPQQQQGPLKVPAQHQYLPQQQQQQQQPGQPYPGAPSAGQHPMQPQPLHAPPAPPMGHHPPGPCSMQPGALPAHQQARQYLGIRLEGGLWFADLEFSNKRITLGYRCTAQEAAQLYDRAAYVLKGRDSQLNLPLALNERAELDQHSETSFLAKLAEENHLLWGGQPLEAAAAPRGHFPVTATASSSCLENPGQPQQQQQQQQTVAVGAMASDGSAERVSNAGASNGGRSRKRQHNGQGSSSSGGNGGSNGSGAPPGVRWVQSANKWLAYIRLNGSSLTLGYRKKMADAAKLHERAKYKLGEEGEGAGLSLSAEEKRELDAMSKKEFLAWVEVENARQRGYSSLFTGVSWSNMTKKWEAYIRVKGRQQYLGLFSCETDAALAYDKALVLRDGPNANTNAKRFPTIFDGLVPTAEAGGADADGSKGGAGAGGGASKEDASEVTHSAAESKECAKGDAAEGQQKRQKHSKGAPAGQRSKEAGGGQEDGPEPSLSSLKLKDLQRSSSLSTGVRPSCEEATQQQSHVTASTASGDDSRPRKGGAAPGTNKLAAAKSSEGGAATSSVVTQLGKAAKKEGKGTGKVEDEASLWEASRDLLMLRDRKLVPGLEEGAGDTKDAEVEEGEVREEEGAGVAGEAMSPVERKPDTPLAAWAPVGSSGKKVGQFQRSADSLKKKGKKLLFGSAALAAGPLPEGAVLAPPPNAVGAPLGTPPTKEAAMLLLLPAKRAAEDAIQRQKSSVEEEEDDEDEGGTLSQLIPNCLPRVASTNYAPKPQSLLAGGIMAEGDAGAPLWAKKRRQ